MTSLPNVHRVWTRTFDGEVLTFGHEGVLYRNSFMMYDHQSDSLWLHVTGEALKGPKKGKQLKFLPAEIMSWKLWKTLNPHTKVLLGEKVDGFMGTHQLKDNLSSFGLAIGSGRTPTLFRYELLQRVPLLNERVDDKPVVLSFDKENSYAVCFSSEVGSKVLYFDAIQPSDDDSEKRLLMRDSETGSSWLRMTGECLKGELKGQFLERLPATSWLGKRWKGFYPKGRIVGIE